MILLRSHQLHAYVAAEFNVNLRRMWKIRENLQKPRKIWNSYNKGNKSGKFYKNREYFSKKIGRNQTKSGKPLIKIGSSRK